MVNIGQVVEDGGTVPRFGVHDFELVFLRNYRHQSRSAFFFEVFTDNWGWLSLLTALVVLVLAWSRRLNCLGTPAPEPRSKSILDRLFDFDLFRTHFLAFVIVSLDEVKTFIVGVFLGREVLWVNLVASSFTLALGLRWLSLMRFFSGSNKIWIFVVIFAVDSAHMRIKFKNKSGYTSCGLNTIQFKLFKIENKI